MERSADTTPIDDQQSSNQLAQLRQRLLAAIGTAASGDFNTSQQLIQALQAEVNDSAPTDGQDAAFAQLTTDINHSTEVIGKTVQAQEHQHQRGYAQALTSLQSAIQVSIQLPSDAPALTEVLQTLQETIAAEQHRTSTEEQQLKAGDELHKQHKLQEAAEQFIVASSAFNPDIQRRANQRLIEVQNEMQTYDREVRRANATRDPIKAASLWQEAHKRWPTGPEAEQNLIKGFVKAGEAALAQSDLVQARGYYQSAQNLAPADDDIRAALSQLDRFDQINASIAQLEEQIDQLTRSGAPIAGDDIELRAEIERQIAATSKLPTLQQSLQQLDEQLNQRQTAWRIILAAAEQAAPLALDGQWTQALQVHLETLAALGKPLPALAQRQHTAWQAAQQACTHAQQAGFDALREAQENYTTARAIIDFRTLISTITTIDADIRSAEQAMQRIGRSVPTSLQNIATSAGGVRQRAQAALSALQARSRQEGLTSIRESIRVLGRDDTLAAIEQKYLAEINQQIPVLFQRAEEAERLEAFEDARDIYREIRIIDPDNQEAASRLSALDRRVEFENALRSAEAEADIAGGSLTAARNAFRRALETFQRPEFQVPDTLRNTIRELLALGDQDFNEALANDQKYQFARSIRERILTAEGWYEQRAARLTEQWLAVAREAAIRGVISSLAQVGDTLSSYRTALNYHRSYSSDESLALLGDAQNRLRQSLLVQTDKLISRTEDALKLGEYETAIRNLNSLDKDYYQPIDSEFPHLLNALDEDREFSQARTTSESQRSKADQLKQQAQDIEAALTKAQQAFDASELVEADRILQGITLNPVLKDLDERVMRLKDRTKRTREQVAQSSYSEQIVRMQVTLQNETRHMQFVAILAQVDAFAETLDWVVLPATARPAFDTLKVQLIQLRNNLEQVASYEAAATQAKEQQLYDIVANSLQSAIRYIEAQKITQLSGEVVRLQADYDQAQAQLKRRSACADALAEAERSFAIGEYATARSAYALARSLGANVAEHLQATQVGELLLAASAAWNKKAGLAQAREQLALAIRLSTQNSIAQRFATQIENQRALLDKAISDIERELPIAQVALENNRLAEAERALRTILSLDTSHPQATDLLQRQIALREEQSLSARIADLFAQIELERTRANDLAAAGLLKDLEALRTDDPVVINLKVELEQEQAANEQLRKARSEIYSGRFNNARHLIQSAEEYSAEALFNEVSQLLEDLETAYRANTIYPIRDLMRDERFRDALRRCTDSLKYAESEQLKADINDLISTIVKRWVEKTIATSQGRLRTATEEQTYKQLVEELETLRQELDSFPESAAITQLIRQTSDERLRLRLENIRGYLNRRALLYRTEGMEWREIDEAQRDTVEPLSLQDAQSQLEHTLQEANVNNLDQVAAEARGLLQVLDEQDHVEQLYGARTLFRQASSRATTELADQTLTQARSQLQRVLQHPQFRKDAKALALQDEIDASRLSLKRSNEEIGRAERALARGLYPEALHNLRRISNVYPLVQAKYQVLERVLRLLEDGQACTVRQDWQAAIEKFRAAIQIDPMLEFVAKDIERCQSKLSDEVWDKVGVALRHIPPDSSAAKVSLDAAENEGWIHPDRANQVPALRRWIESRRRAYAGILLLNPNRPEPEKALEALRIAQRMYSDPEDDQLTQWIVFGQALQRWQAGELNSAYTTIGKITEPVANTAFVIDAQRMIRERLLELARNEAQQALQIWDVANAGRAIQRGLDIMPDDTQLLALRKRQQFMLDNAPTIRVHMQTGWKALEDALGSNGDLLPNLATAHQAFEQALQLDEQFHEATHWLAFTQAFERGIRAANVEAYQRAQQAYEAAAEALVATALLPIVLGTTKLQQERRIQAATVARECSDLTKQLATLFAAIENTNVSAPNPDDMVRYLSEAVKITESYHRLISRPILNRPE